MMSGSTRARECRPPAFEGGRMSPLAAAALVGRDGGATPAICDFGFAD